MIRGEAGTRERGNRVRNSGSRSGLRWSLQEPVDDGAPVFGFRIVERGVVRARGENEQIGAAAGAGEEFFSHVALEETVAVALDNEDGESAFAQGFFG